jgi:hypothetical protein
MGKIFLLCRAMTKQEFNQKEINERADILWRDGVFIEDRVIYNRYQIKVYSLKSFFVEVWVNVQDLKIEKERKIHG